MFASVLEGCFSESNLLEYLPR